MGMTIQGKKTGPDESADIPVSGYGSLCRYCCVVRPIVLFLHGGPAGNKQKNCRDYHDKEEEIHHGCVNLPL